MKQYTFIDQEESQDPPLLKKQTKKVGWQDHQEHSSNEREFDDRIDFQK